MGRGTAFNLALLLGTVVAFGSGGYLAFAGDSDRERGRALHARALVSGPGGIQGVVRFTQRPCPGCPTPAAGAPLSYYRNFPEPTVEVVARISGPPGALQPGAHGMHIHEAGACEPPYTTALGHFDPGPNGNSSPDANHPFHMGDIPNLIVSRAGAGRMRHTTSRITLSPGPLSIFDGNGSAVIVHLNPDRGTTGVAGGSGGPRIACGVIQPSGGGGGGD